MIILLSPAKKLDETQTERPGEVTSPRFQKDAAELTRVARELSVGDLRELMHISEDLAELNVKRFKAFNLSGKSNSAKPAIDSFNGDVYWGYEAETMSKADREFAQDHLRILSGLYGLLRPQDAIQPYRLEMGSKLENPRGKNLYEFWKAQVTEQLRRDAEAVGAKGVLNVASNEYVKAVDKKALGLPILTPKFLDIKDGKARALMFYAKRARGMMARWAVDKRVDDPKQIMDFDGGGYAYDEQRSTDSVPVFTRPQPPTQK